MAHGAIQDAVGAMKLGAFDYLLKPFDLDELSLTMEKLVQMQTLANLSARKFSARIYFTASKSFTCGCRRWGGQFHGTSAKEVKS